MQLTSRRLAQPDARDAARPLRARIGPDCVSWLSRPRGGHGEVVLVPGEHVRLLAVDLPVRDARARLKALPFAVEPMMAQLPDAFHAALGQRIEGSRFLAAAVSRTRMLDWIAMLEAAGTPHAALVPEPFMLQVPEPGVWTIRRDTDRVIVRTPDGAGFSASSALFALVHDTAGQPILDEISDAQWAQAPASDSIDLRQGQFAARRTALLPGLKAAAVILAAGAGLHAAIALADLVALDRAAATREAQAARLLEQAGLDAGLDPVAAILRNLPATDGHRFHLFAMLDTMAGALDGQDGISVRALQYRNGARQVSLDLQAGDLRGLQAAERALADAGFIASSGSASARDGRAEATIIISPGTTP